MQVLGQRTMGLAGRDLIERERRLAPEARRCGVVFANRHGVLRPLQEFGQLLAVPQLHVGLLPVRAAAHVLALPLHFAVRERRANALHLGTEQRLDSALDVDLVGIHRHLEHQRLAVFADDRGLLGDERAPDNVCQFHNVSRVIQNSKCRMQTLWFCILPFASCITQPRASCSFSNAALVSTTRRVSITSRALTRLLASIRTPSILRTESTMRSSGLTSTSSALPSMPRRLSISAAALVLISATLNASTTITAPSRSFCVSAARSAPFSTFFGS